MIVAHRGGSDICDENTLDCFAICVVNGYSAMEFDVHQTVDNVLVVVHDNIINDIYITDLTFDELPQSIPSLDQVFNTISEIASKYKLPVPLLNIEIKGWDMSKNVFMWLKKRLLNSQSIINIKDIVVTSFLHTELLLARSVFPELRLGFIYRCWPVDLQKHLNKNKIDLIVLSKHCVSKKNIDKLENVEIWVYTINKFSEAYILIECGLDGIITDLPLSMKNKLCSL